MCDSFHIQDEKKLLQQVATGDEKAFRNLFQHYYKFLGAFVVRITKSQEITEEVVQDVFLKIWQTRENLVEISDFRAYLFILSRNHAFNCLKKIAIEKAKTVDPAIYESIYDQNDQGGIYVLLDEAIDKLPKQQRQAFILSRYERLTYLQIADKMHISKETVKTYLKIATESVSKYLRDRYLVKLLLILYFLF